MSSDLSRVAAQDQDELVSARILDAATEALIAQDSSGRVEFANRAFRDLLPAEHRLTNPAGLHITEVLDLLVAACDEPSILAQPSSIDVEALTRRSLPDRIVLNDDRVLEVSVVRVAAEGSEAETHLVWRFRDVTQTVSTQRLLEMSAQRLQATSGAQSKVLAMISHDVRAPIGSLIGMADLLLDESSDDRSRRIVSGVKSSAVALIHVVDQVLDAADLVAGRFAINAGKFDADEAIYTAVLSCAAVAERKNLMFTVGIDPEFPREVIADHRRIGQIIANLCGNAVKFTDRGEVAVTIECTRDDRRTDMRIRVQDTGPGLKEENREQLFDAFARGTGATDREGVGLGLYIVGTLVRAMNGSVTIESTVGEGSIFEVALPVRMVDGPNRRPSVPAKDVCVVCDLPLARLGIAKTLKRHGWIPHIISWEQFARSEAGSQPALLLIPNHDNPHCAGAAAKALEWIERGARVASVGRLTDYDPAADMASSSAGSVIEFRPTSGAARILSALVDDGQDRKQGKRRRSEKLPALKALLVDDDPISLEIGSRLLGSLGLRASTANTISQALTRFREIPFDIVITDISLDGESGLHLARQIRSLEESTGQPRAIIVALTGHTSEESGQAAKAAGMDAQLAKPTTRDQLERTIRKLLPDTFYQGLPAIDLGVLATLDEETGDVGLAAETAQLFLTDALAAAPQFANAIRTDDLDSVLSIAHRLKSSAMMVGAGPLAKALVQIEAAAAESSGSEVARLAAELGLDRLWEHTAAALQSYLDDH